MDGKKYALIFRQRAAGRCKAVGKAAEIPPGVASLNTAVEEDGLARDSDRRCWTP